MNKFKRGITAEYKAERYEGAYMGYTIPGAQFGNGQEIKQGASINIKSNKEEKSGTRIQSFQGVLLSGAQVNRSKMDSNTYRSLLNETDDVKQQIMNSASAAKDNLKALFNRLSGADAVEIDKDGFNLNDMTQDEMVGIVDKIKIQLATYCDDYQLTTAGGISKEEICMVTGNDALADKVEQKLNSANVPVTQNNAAEMTVAVNKVSQLTQLTENAKNYLVANHLDPTIDNVYMAEHINQDNASDNISTPKDMAKDIKESEVSDEEWSQIEGQVKDILKEAGLEVNDQNLYNAREFLKRKIPVVKNTLLYKAQLDKLNFSDIDKDSDSIMDNIVDALKDGKTAGSALLIGKQSVIKRVASAINVLNSATYKNVEDIVNNGKDLTIENLRFSMGTIDKAAKAFGYAVSSDNTEGTVNNPEDSIQAMDINTQKQPDNNQENQINSDDNRKNQIKTDEFYRNLQEARIRLTASAGMYLVNKGIDIETVPVTQLVKELQDYEQTEAVKSGMSAEGIKTMSLVRKAMFDIENAPDETIGKVVAEKQDSEALTINDFARQGEDLRRQYEQAGKEYETFGTKERKDYGDSVDKAIKASTDDILRELGIDDSQANRDAIRILGMNGMEINADSINNIKEIYSTLKNIVNNMNPDIVMNMIKENINPLNSDIHVVDMYVNQMKSENNAENAAEKYSSFLFRLDRTDSITPQERKQFIGIYKMLNIFTKDAGVAIGALVKQDADITMQNLFTAYESRRAGGIDSRIDDSTPQIQAVKNYYENLFSDTASSITPLTLKKLNDEQEIIERQVEGFCEAAKMAFDEKEEAAYYNEYLEQMRQAADAENRVIEQLANNNQPVTLNNIKAMESIMQGEFFGKIFTNIEKGKNDTYGKESKGSEGNQNDYKELKENADAFIEKIGHKEVLDNAYDILKENSDRQLKNAIDSDKTGDYENIEELRRINKEIGLIKNLSLKHDYKIPFVTKKGIAAINLTLIQDDENRGRVSVNFNTEEFGNVSVEMQVNTDKVNIYAMSDKDDLWLKDKLDTLSDSIKDDFGIDNVQVSVTRCDRISRVTYAAAADSVATDKLYGMAKCVIKAVTQD